MKPRTKAVIYSLLIFPGSGFFILNQKRIGYGFIAATLGFLSVVMVDAMYKAQIIADTLITSATKRGVLDPQLLLRKLEALPGMLPEQITTTAGLLPDVVVSLCTYAIIVIWGLGIAGLWRIKV